MPIDRFRSQRYLSKPSLLRFKDTKETCALSIAWTCIPESEHSNVASVRRSFTASKTFFRIELCIRRASNIVSLDFFVYIQIDKFLNNWQKAIRSIRKPADATSNHRLFWTITRLLSSVPKTEVDGILRLKIHPVFERDAQ